MKEKVIIIFDIGKTNKKFFLFNRELQLVHEEYICLNEILDDDNFQCDNLEAIEEWIIDRYNSTLTNSKYEIEAINFSSYGASLVNLGNNGKPVTPFYNYTKPFPENILQDFFRKYGPVNKWSAETSSPSLGMLNSGLQLYWLKYQKPELYVNICHSLHFPQYLSYLFTGQLSSEFTSIGCHTGLWNFAKNKYHEWVSEESVSKLFPSIVPTNTISKIKANGNNILIGKGIHDTSSALLPYLQKSEIPFILISTGTWSICLNPFNNEPLTEEEIINDCLNFLQINGQPVKVSRLFLGNEFNIWVEKLASYFKVDKDYHKRVRYDDSFLKKSELNLTQVFVWESIKLPIDKNLSIKKTNLNVFESYEEAYHNLMKDLMDLQLKKIRLVLGNTSIKRIYVDGGFSDNEVFISLLKNNLLDFEIIPVKVPLGSALGAAMVLQDHYPKIII